MRYYHFFTNRWWLVYGAGLFLCLFYVFMAWKGEPSSDAVNIIYVQVMLRELGIVSALLPIILLAIGVFFYCRKWKVLDNPSFLMLAVPLAGVLYVLLVVSQPSIGDQRLFHQQTVSANGHVYNLAQYHLGNVTIYECDGLSIACQSIYRGGSIITLEYDPECDVSPYLTVNDQSLELIVQCKTIFYYELI